MQEKRKSNKTQHNDDFWSLGIREGGGGLEGAWKKNVAAFIVWQAITGSAGLWIPMINGMPDKNVQVDRNSSPQYPSLYV